MRVIWTGSISFGLVNIPIRLYPAVDPQTKGFRMLHKKDKVPLEFKRWCPKHKQEVPWADVAKGLEIGKNKYVILEKEELERLKPKRTDEIEIIEIIDSWQVDPVFYNHHYFLGPDTEKEKAYFLFKHALEQSAKAAIGRFVMREREHVCAIEAYKEGLLLTTLNFAHEIRDIKKIDYATEVPTLKQQEVNLAAQLIEKLQKKEFDITEFQDTYLDELKVLVKKKLKGKIIEIKAETRKVKKEENLIEALKASL